MVTASSYLHLLKYSHSTIFHHPIDSLHSNTVPILLNSYWYPLACAHWVYYECLNPTTNYVTDRISDLAPLVWADVLLDYDCLLHVLNSNASLYSILLLIFASFVVQYYSLVELLLPWVNQPAHHPNSVKRGHLHLLADEISSH